MDISRRLFLQLLGTVAVNPCAWLDRPRTRSVQYEGTTLAAQEPVSFFERGWSRVLDETPLPDWFVENRVHVHTHLGPAWYGRAEFSRAEIGIARLGAHVFTRAVKVAAEDPLWPSALPTDSAGNPLLDRDRTLAGKRLPGDRNLVQEMVDRAHAHGLHIIAYHWHMADATVARIHPEWRCRQPNGRSIQRRKRGERLDITSGYRDIVLQRLLELAGMGVDGFYFDELHMPEGGCWGTFLEEEFRRVTGEDVPQRKDERDPVYCEFLDFQAYQVEETFAYWRRQVRERYPDVVFIISAGVVPALVNRRITTNLLRIADSAKNEFNSALLPGFNLHVFKKNPRLARPRDDVRRAFGWTLLRDSSGGRPPHIWAPGFPNMAHAMAFTSAVLTYGGIANLNIADADVAEASSPEGEAQRAALGQAIRLGDRVSPHLARTRPVRWAAVHWSELARNHCQGKHLRAWREVIWPTLGAFRYFIRQGVPVGIIDDARLDRGSISDYRVLFLPTPDELTTGQGRAVDEFAAGGGVVIRQQPDWMWHEPEANAAAAAAFAAALAPHLGTAPVTVTGEGLLHAVAYKADVQRRLVVALTNDFNWVRISGWYSTRPRGGTLIDPPPALRNVRIHIRHLPSIESASDAITGQRLHIRRDGDRDVIQIPDTNFAVAVLE